MSGPQFQTSSSHRAIRSRLLLATGHLVIEIDGGQHRERMLEEAARTAFSARSGDRVLRFWNNEIFRTLEGVPEQIRQALESPHHHLLPRMG
ncbi:MAG: DUF559 domain-containing protein [Betaproteobacteria bacterium]|nr:DUF559 domain-containing protein [Betaproteobacteria bacterium]